MPDTVTVTFEVPEDFSHLGRGGYIKRFEDALQERERAHREERKRTGRTVLGAKRCKLVKLGDVSRSYEKWFQLRPVIAAKMKADRIAAIRALQAFRQQYYEALAAWRDGNREVLFPAGTWWMCKFAGAAVS